MLSKAEAATTSRLRLFPSKIPSDFQRYLGSAHDLCLAPLWNVSREAYVGGLIYGFKDETGRWRRSEEASEVDAALMRIASITAEEEGTTAVSAFILPVNYEVFRRPTKFYALLRKIKELKPQVAQRLTIELVDVPRGHPSHLLLEKVRSLSNAINQVILRTYRIEDLSRRLRSIGIRAITINFNAVAVRGREKELARLISSAHDFGVSTMVVGVGSLHALTATLAAGADFICGPATSIPGARLNSGAIVSAGSLYKSIMARSSRYSAKQGM
jgi:hypothetical protein